MNQDLDHLRLLSIFHYVVGGLAALFACFPFIHVAIGIALVSGALGSGHGNEAPPEFVGWLFIVIGCMLILIGWSVTLTIFMAGRFLARQTNYTYCLVIAGIECLFMPFGTVLGVFTIIVLLRPTVKTLFDAQPPSAA
jgi:hypothetical protein